MASVGIQFYHKHEWDIIVITQEQSVTNNDIL